MRLKLRANKPKDARIVELFKPGNWTRLPTPVLEALIRNDTGLGKNEMQIIFAVIRETFGRQVFANRIFRQRLQELTGLDISIISHKLTALRRRNILKRTKPHSWEQRKAAEWEIVPNPKEWLPAIPSGGITHGVKRPRIEMMNHPLKPGRNPPPYKDVNTESVKERKNADGLTVKSNRIPIEKREARY